MAQNAKNTYRVGNWKEYNSALIQRGSLSVWISEEAIENWFYDGPAQWGADPTYSDLAIETCLTLRLVYDLPLRQTQGFIASLFRLMDLDLPVPDYSTLSRRQAELWVDLFSKSKDEQQEGEEAPRHIVIDSTGLKVYGEGEWKKRQHGKSKKRTWRKAHIAIDPKTGQITATELTGNDKHDCSQVEPLLQETMRHVGEISHVGGDGAYDKWKSYEAIAAVDAYPVIPPMRNARIKQHGNCSGAPLPRDENIRYVRRHGRKKWKREHGYHLRSIAETAVYRFKRIIGGVLRAIKLEHQRVETRLGGQILNTMWSLGRPESYAVAAN